MKVEIVEVADPGSGQVVFRLAGARDAASGYWSSGEDAQVGECAVELDVPGEVTAWSVVAPPEPPESAVVDVDGGVAITAEVLPREDADGAFALRVGVGVVLVELSGDVSAVAPGTWVSLSVPKVVLYPFSA
ncbi:hypothetical protein KCV87_05795 [Actinosynnema pretiosum subsp. pretiosum]|uniref:Transport-associated OB type 2 domain-containing protein n=2 Tax=Actinosynnema TaxID=40566 RepID=C6WQB9_ACTMD|nr:hypothetical protein [Actinosynnema mirum]ACU36773.1 hypothetical protein Amir_2844 [Actinosynnema mirum DSM 43827]AXX30233.1 hypothetical protein APASM_2868 [Actinosynnema pretiosum subsp. pretiosum]QUF05609.1 hypothetical protein KCV87_05795 [Actinosynnema pretiosum subsp. pretiosum]